MIKSYVSTTPSERKIKYSTKVYKLMNYVDNVGFSSTQYFVYKIVFNLSFV